MNIRFAVVVLMLLALAGQAAAAEPIMPQSGAVAGWERDGALRRFSAAGLYGHINGGAELFLELGFRELLVQNYRNGEQEMTLEVYRMEGPKSALAIYIFKCGKETPWPEMGTRNTANRFQATLLRGDCLVLVNSFSGDKALRPAMAGLAGKLLETIPAADYGDPFGELPSEGLVAGSERLVRGEYSLQAIYTFGPGDVLQLGGKIFGVAADYRVGEGGEPVTRIWIDYPDERDSIAALAHLADVLDPTLELLQQKPGRLVFQDHAGRIGYVGMQQHRVSISINLAGIP